MKLIQTFKRWSAVAMLTLVAAVALAPATAQAQAFTNFAENKIVDAVFRAQALGAPATFHVALYTTACDDTGAGTEVTGGNYARQPVTSALTTWNATQGGTSASSGTGGQTSNINAISWGTVTWSGTVTHWSLMDASTAGNMWICAALTASQAVSSGNTVQFAAGALTITLQ